MKWVKRVALGVIALLLVALSFLYLDVVTETRMPPVAGDPRYHKSLGMRVVEAFSGAGGLWAIRKGDFTSTPFTGDSAGALSAYAYAMAAPGGPNGIISFYPGTSPNWLATVQPLNDGINYWHPQDVICGSNVAFSHQAGLNSGNIQFRSRQYAQGGLIFRDTTEFPQKVMWRALNGDLNICLPLGVGGTGQRAVNFISPFDSSTISQATSSGLSSAGVISAGTRLSSTGYAYAIDSLRYGASGKVGTLTGGGPANFYGTVTALTNAVVTDSLRSNKGLYIGGQFVNKVLRASATLDFDVSAVNCQTLTVTVTGAAVGDEVFVGVPNGSVVADETFSAWVSAANTVSIRVCDQGGAGNPASGTYKVTVVQ